MEDGTPDLWVTEVAQESIPYNYTTKDKFNQDLVDNKVLQIGYFKTAYQESDGKPVTIAWQNVLVKSTDWVASTEFADFPYEAKIELTDFVDYTTVPQVVFDIADTMSGNYAPICKSGDKCVYIYGKVQNEITLKTVITFAPNVNGASVTGGGYNNRGKWVASTTYAIDDLVYTDNGQFVCIEGITSTTSPEQDTQHWQATFVATGKTTNGLTISGQDNGTEVQKTFDGSTAVEIAFDETTMTAKEVNGVLKVGAKGTVPEALPQEASALKSGSLPTSGWSTDTPIFEGKVEIPYSNNGIYKNIIPYEIGTGTKTYEIKISRTKPEYTEQTLTGTGTVTAGSGAAINTNWGAPLYIQLRKDGVYAYRGYSSSGASFYILSIKIAEVAGATVTYTISDTSITANSDILMELTDDGGVKSYSMEAGKMTVIRDTVPTQPIPYTYKVKQTNASGQFTLVNHFVPSIPESPTSLPVSYKKASGSLPTSGWTETNTPFYTNSDPNWGSDTETTLGYCDPAIAQLTNGFMYAVNGTTYTYTISDTSITANTSVKMYLTDEGGVKAYSKAVGSIQVIRDSVPTNAIPYEYEVEQTSAEGLFEVINAYVPAVPTKTSELTNDSGFITAGEWKTWSDTSVLTEEGLYEIVTTEYPSDGNKTLFVRYEQGKPNNGACWVSVATANSISVVTPICSGDGTLSVERRLANSSGPADLLTFKYRKIN